MKYLLSCRCGKHLLIDARQAGQVLKCSCGRQVEAPTMREIRRLPVAEDKPTTVYGAGWNANRGAAFLVGLLLVLAGVPTAFYSYRAFQQAKIPAEFEAHVAAQLQQAEPAELFDYWHSLKEHGLGDASTSPLQTLRRLRLFYGTLSGLGAAGIFVGVVSALGSIVLRKRLE